MKSGSLSPEYTDEQGVNKITGLTLSRLRADRFRRRGLPYVKVGRSVLYDLNDVRRYLNSRKIKHD